MISKTRQNFSKDETSLEEFINSAVKEIPEDVSNLKLPDPSLLGYYKEQQQRVIWIEGMVGDGNVDCDTNLISIINKILLFNKEDINLPVEERKPIKILINSVGGDVQSTWVLINTIKNSKTPVWTINVCSALSAAAHILTSGHKRFGLKGSYVLIHSGSTTMSGSREAVDSAKKYFDSLDKKLNEQIISDTTITPKELKKNAPFDWYLSDDESLEKGVINEIVVNLDDIL